ncbi:MAG: DNA primase [Bdellovibrionia bacterium]
MRFSPEFVERVAEANNLVDIISQYTQLKPSGSGLMGRCPFPDHQEKTPSFSVSELKQVYHCFGCHKKGNIYTFLQQYNGMNFPEAVEYLANRASIPLPVNESFGENQQRDREQEKKKLLLKVNKLAAQYFSEQLLLTRPDHPVRLYIKKRGLSEETIQTFGIGYATAEWDGLEKYLVQKGIPLALAEEARLLKARTQGKSGYYDIFRDRLMFPITTPMGEPVAFGGRIIDAGEPKYLNSPETPVFVKGRVLYGLNQTARYIRTEDVALIVEGYMDLVSLFQAGIKNAVATMGTALTPEHGKLLKRMTRNVVALFDGDAAGVEAAERSLPILLAADLYPKGLTLPDKMDPDDFVKQYGADALKSELDKAPDLFSMVLERWLEGYRGESSQKVQFADKIKPIFNAIPDARLRDLYISEAASRLGVAIPWLRQAVGLSAGPTSVRPSSIHRTGYKGEDESPAAPALTSENEKISLKEAPKVELILMNLILKSRANFDQFLEQNMIDSVHSEGVRSILTKAVDVYRQDLNKFDKLTSLLVNYVDRPELLFANESNLLSSEGFDQEAESKLLQDCFRRVRENFLKEQTRQLAKELKSELTSEKLEQIMNIQRSRLSLKKGNQS